LITSTEGLNEATTISSLRDWANASQRVFLSRLSAESLAEVEQRGIRREWPRHTVIFRMREPCSGIHIVLDGLVKLYRSNPSGREQIILLEGPGGALTIAPLFDDGTHVTTAATLKPTTSLFLKREDFLHIYQKYPEMREAVTIEMARRFRALVDLVDTITLKAVPARVATRLIELATVHDALDGSHSFNMTLSQDEMAQVLGTSRESVARALGTLRSAGIIEQRGSTIRIVDANALLASSQAGTPVQSFAEAFRLRGDPQ
jgi:CRP-like cAMP-binding protein